jgi:F0F1-type ATP synthase assembly protein I
MHKIPGIGLVMGAALGILVDVSLGTMPFGLIFGAGLGLVFSVVFAKGSGTDSRE